MILMELFKITCIEEWASPEKEYRIVFMLSL